MISITRSGMSQTMSAVSLAWNPSALPSGGKDGPGGLSGGVGGADGGPGGEGGDGGG